MSHPDFLLDKRVVERNLAKGILTRADLDKHLTKLPDVEHNAEVCAPPAAEPRASEDE